jgi:anti-sigma28 factor (negative regulator of flagellin synthesis)
MNPLSSIPPTPPVDLSSPLRKIPSSAQDPLKDASDSPLSPPIDNVSLSLPTQEVSHYLERMSEIPDIRQTRITQIQRALTSQTYDISSEEVAEKILGELPSAEP